MLSAGGAVRNIDRMSKSMFSTKLIKTTQKQGEGEDT